MSYTKLALESRLSELAARVSVADGGFSVDPDTLVDVSGGYAVSIFPEVERVYFPDDTPDALCDYLLDVVSTFSVGNVVFGGWHNPETGLIHLDLSVTVDDRETALRLAREHAQLAVWDFSAGESIAVRVAA